MTAQILHGNNLDILPTLADCSVDSIVTDPPYELGFMGKQWDATGIAYNVELWRECLRVLKPGGHLLAFGGTRTYHRMAVAIEDAGFEIRDSIHWVYGSGFPKSLDISKAINKAAGAEREVIGKSENGIAGGTGKHAGENNVYGFAGQFNVTAPATDAARQWAGWGTALKPAHEPIVLARKPLIGTVANNVLAHGTGALNIDGCRVQRVENDTPSGWSVTGSAASENRAMSGANYHRAPKPDNDAGRWPANIVFTHAAECDTACVPGCPVAELDAQSGVSKPKAERTGPMGGSRDGLGMGRGGDAIGTWPGDNGGGASRFFTVTEWSELDGDSFIYCPKPGKKERNAGLEGLPEREVHRLGAGIGEGFDPHAPAVDHNFHPTVKPLALMRYLIRLVTPPGGTVLEPFAGSGTTLAAATLEGFNSIGIELTADYLPIIKARIAWAEQQTENEAPTLFST